MRHRGLPAAFALAIVLSVVVSATATAASNPDDLSVVNGGVSQVDAFDAPKSVSGKLAQTDPSLLNKTSAELINVVVKLDYDAIGSYAGGIGDLKATSPSVTGRSIHDNARAVSAYRAYLSKIERTALNQVNTKIASATVGSVFRLAYGGFSLRLPANQVGALLTQARTAAAQGS